MAKISTPKNTTQKSKKRKKTTTTTTTTATTTPFNKLNIDLKQCMFILILMNLYSITSFMTKCTQEQDTTTTVVSKHNDEVLRPIVTKEDNNNETTTIAVFYNVFTKSKKEIPYVKSIVNEQLSYLLPQRHKVFVRSIGVQFDIDNTTHIKHNKHGDEDGTLNLLWTYCKFNPTSKVVYIHTKGSFNPSEENDKFRKFLTRGALSETCANIPSSCNVCSSRMSPVPHPHTPGNMWLARCDYIQQLIEPMTFQDSLSTKVKIDKSGIKGKKVKGSIACIGQGRYAAEHWVHSHPTVMPCDLSDDESYNWNYEDIPNYDFKMNLTSAPRFNLQKYKGKTKICKGWGFSLNDRLVEYKSLFGLVPSESWWGWKLYDRNS